MLLEKINEPSDLKNLSVGELNALAAEIRAKIISVVSQNGGHLAPSLGTVELTLALESVFSGKRDKIVWDVGHQAYTHKLITGRRDKFSTLRTMGGISGFPKRSESPWDAFGVGHASTSVSAALGLALARDLEGERYQVTAVIGDGALTGGEAFEAINQAGASGTRLLVVLNDNEMSIDKNVGALSAYFNQIRTWPQYNRAKKDVENILLSIPKIGGRVLKTASSLKDGVKSLLVPGTWFEELGFSYIGPLDGHNIGLIIDALRRVKELNEPVILHVHTVKGKGYAPAERSPDKFHGIGTFDPQTGASRSKQTPPTYTQVFGETLANLAAKDKDIVAITAAMPAGTGLTAFRAKYPARFFDVGIAEGHAVTLAAALAAGGKKPVLALYSTFAQRGYDQILHDVCLQNLPVVFALDRGGLVGEDGPTHHGAFDLSYLRHIPNMTIMAPKDEGELPLMLEAALSFNRPAAIRYPRGAGVGVDQNAPCAPIELGRAEVIREAGDVGFLAVGATLAAATLAAAKLSGVGITAAVANMRFVKPMDTELISRWAKEKKLLVTVEENVLIGGFGSGVAEFLLDNGLSAPLLRLGIGDEFVAQGKRGELLELVGLTADKIFRRVEEKLKKIDMVSNGA